MTARIWTLGYDPRLLVVHPTTDSTDPLDPDTLMTLAEAVEALADAAKARNEADSPRATREQWQAFDSLAAASRRLRDAAVYAARHAERILR